MSDSSPTVESVAIIGLAGRFPGAASVAELWKHICDGRELIHRFSDEELAFEGVPAAVLAMPNYVKANTVLENVENFDAAFFGYNPREAEVIDPQQRIFLETAWEAMENAGYDSDRYKGPIGVFAGVGMNSYLFQVYANRDVVAAVGHYQTMISNDKDYLATRVAYKLNLKGPAVMIQSACSTSLVAVQFAYQSLLNYQCDMALAGGISVNLPQRRGYFYQEGMILSPDGHCRAFDEKAQGTVPGQGVGVVILKRLSDAVADGDTILAVIRGAAVNNDGAHKIGYTAPSIDGQAEVIASALALGGVSADTIGYVEAHGTGTTLGDPIEVAALTLAYRASTERAGYCALGSLKSNVGHMDAAAGVAGLIKATLALHHGLIPPSLHFERPNPKIDFARSPFFVNTELRRWETPGRPRRAAVSAFGIGGTNAHAVLEEAPVPAATGPHRPVQLLLLSAKTDTALEVATEQLLDHFQAHPELALADAAYTLQVGRRQYDRRRAVLCRDLADAVDALRSMDPKRVLTSGAPPRNRSAVFLFSGQGSQHVGMGRELYDSEQVFRTEVDRCAEMLQPWLRVDLREVLYATGSDADASARLHQTWLTQPALFVTEWALARLWMSWGVQPQAMIGHSIGEYVAACLAGVFTLEDGLKLVAGRGRLMQSCPPGVMLSVPMAAEALAAWVAEQRGLDIAVAASNGPALSVLSGPEDAVAACEERMASRGVSTRRLHTSHAFHSSMMDPILGAFEELVRGVVLRPPQIPYVSNLSGRWITAREATDPAYWAAHLRRTVKFSEGMRELWSQPDRALIEVGPGQVLLSLARQHFGQPNECPAFSSLPHPQDPQSALVVLLGTAAKYWLAGGAVDWAAFQAGGRRRRVPLPTYPFERQRFWVEAKAGRPATLAERASVRQSDIADWFYVPSWRRSDLPNSVELLSGTEWLVFAGTSRISAMLIERIRSSEGRVTMVRAGESYAKVGIDEYVVAAARRADYAALIRDLRSAGRVPDGVAHLWCLDDDLAGAEGAKPCEERGFGSLMALVQALGDLIPERAMRVKVFANGMHEVTGEESVQPEKSLVLGPCRVMAQEYANVRCTCVDVRLTMEDAASQAKLVEMLARELAAEGIEPVVAYRGRHRWVQGVEPRRLDAVASVPKVLRQEGVYLVTGGLGGIGLALAGYLAKTVKARLILVGRKAVPDRSAWAGLAEGKGGSAEDREKFRRLVELEAWGSEVLALSADVTDASSMLGVVAQARARFGAIHGVIHAAGIAGDGIMQLRTPEAAAAVLRPKVQGTCVLERVLQGMPLDFVVLCSSVSSWMGGVGQADYCAANAFLDAYAWQRRTGARVYSVNWYAWREVGMAVTTAVPEAWREQREQSLRLGISPEEGCEALARVLASEWPQVVVSPPDFRALLMSSWPASSSGQKGAPAGSVDATPKAAHARPALASEYVAPGTSVERAIAEIWQHLLGIERVGLHDNFFELGGHSLLATQLVARLRQAFAVEFTVAQVFERPTVASLSALVTPAGAQEETEASVEDELARVSARGRRRAERRRQRQGDMTGETTS